MIVIHSMMTYAKTASRWSRRTAPIAASARRKMDADFGDMPGAGWSNGSSPGFNGSAASLSAGSFIRRTSLASCNSLASSSSSNDFEIGSNLFLWPLHPMCEPLDQMVGISGIDLADMIEPRPSHSRIAVLERRRSVVIEDTGTPTHDKTSGGDEPVFNDHWISRCPSHLLGR